MNSELQRKHLQAIFSKADKFRSGANQSEVDVAKECTKITLEAQIECIQSLKYLKSEMGRLSAAQLDFAMVFNIKCSDKIIELQQQLSELNKQSNL